MKFNENKAKQVMAYIILKNGGKPMHPQKLMNLLYLADRECIKRFGYPILDDERYAIPEGFMLKWVSEWLLDNGLREGKDVCISFENKTSQDNE